MQLEYQLFDADGTLVERSEPGELLEFIFGVGQVPPAIERAVDGLGPGESRRVRLSPAEGFGERDEQRRLVVDRGELPPDVRLGDELEAEDEAGGTVFLRVVELDDQVARLDANHPLAGQTVMLELVVRSTRVASSQELSEALREGGEGAGSREPDVLISRLLRRGRMGSPGSG